MQKVTRKSVVRGALTIWKKEGPSVVISSLSFFIFLYEGLGTETISEMESKMK